MPGKTLWFTGLPSAGKSTVADAVAHRLPGPVQVLDGDVLRRELFPELGFSARDRDENVRRTGMLAMMLARHGVTVLVPVVAPYRAARDGVRAAHAAAGIGYLEVWVDAPLRVCARRDVKGLYAKAKAGQLTGMTGVDDPYEPPETPELRLRTDQLDLDECVAAVLALLDEDAPALVGGPGRFGQMR